MAYLLSDGLTLFWIAAILLLTVLYRRYSNKRRLPPGPFGWPILGCYPFFRKDPLKMLTDMGKKYGNVFGNNPLKTLSDMSKKYGNVFGFCLGSQYLVVLNDWDAMIDAYSQSSNLDRPPETFSNTPITAGIAGVNGPEWVQTRRVTSKAMKDVAFHQTHWEELVQEEASDAVERIMKAGKDPVNIRDFFSDIFSKNIITLVFGERFPAGLAAVKVVTKSVDAIIEGTPTLDIKNYSQRLRRILEFFGLEEKHQLPEEIRDFNEYVSNAIEEKIRNPDAGMQNTFLDQYYSQIDNHAKKDVMSYITEGTLKANAAGLLVGASETGRTATIWALIAMADYPEVQRKIHEELDRVVGKDGTILWGDRMKIPYTYATLLESMRWKTVVPISTLRKTTEDMQVQGYHIPKDSSMCTNIWSVHNDPKYWTEPEKFIPERFLLEDGKKVNTNPDSYIPFSYGKRNCPGKLIALMETLICFCKLLQKFKVVPIDGKKVKYDTTLGLTYQATNVQFRFIPRDNE